MTAPAKPVFEYLRVSITDRCNLRCIYCMPPEGIQKLQHAQIIRYEAILAVVRAAVLEGVHRVRVTGGEPLVRKGIVEFIRELSAINGLDDISLTTNGILLAPLAGPLKQAGLRRVNISFDSLRPNRFNRITRLGKIEDALLGLEAAVKHGLSPIKINVVIVPGENDDEIDDFGRFAQETPLVVRFIERMPFLSESLNAPFVSQAEIMERLSKFIEFEKEYEESGGGPAEVYRIKNGIGKLGFISSRTHPFCNKCTRLRLTSAGILLPCLDSRDGIEIGSMSQDQLRQSIRELAKRKRDAAKPCAKFESARCVSLSKIGG